MTEMALGWLRGLMALLGLGSARHARPRQEVRPSTAGLATDGSWKRLLKTWQQADDVAQGRAGHFPFDARGKARLLADLAKVHQQFALLSDRGLLNASELSLLTAELERLTQAVHLRKSSEEVGRTDTATPSAPAKESLHYLSEVVRHLETLIGEDQLHSEAVELVLAHVSADLSNLGNRAMLSQLAMARRSEAGQVRNRAQQAVDAVRARLSDVRMSA